MDEQKGYAYKEYICAFLANMSLFVAGNTLGWSSPTNLILQTEGNEINLTATSDETSWIVSILPLGAAFGPFIACVTLDAIGRKTTLLISGLPFLLGWLCIAIASSIGLIIFGRFLLGIGVGISMTAFPIYIGEIASDNRRGSLGALLYLSLLSGRTCTFWLAQFLGYRMLILVLVMIVILFLTTFPFMPETPHYFLKKDKTDKAEKVLRFLRVGSDADIQEELTRIQLSLTEAHGNKGSIKNICDNKSNMMAVALSFLLVTVLQICGVNVITFYMEEILEGTKSPMHVGYSTVLVGIIQTITAFASLILVASFGRRNLIIASCLGMSLNTGLLGLILYLEYLKSPITDSITWLPLVSITVYYIFFAIGIGSLTWVMICEMLAANIKSVGVTITSSYSWSFAFFSTRFYSIVEEKVGTHWALWLFSISTFISSVFLSIFLPETKGKSLEEVQKELSGLAS